MAAAHEPSNCCCAHDGADRHSSDRLRDRRTLDTRNGGGCCGATASGPHAATPARNTANEAINAAVTPDRAPRHQPRAARPEPAPS